jgi:hypothetical protein
MARNCHHVQKHAWKKFGRRGQAMFNRLWTPMRENLRLEVFDSLTPVQKRVLLWNACWLAADEEKKLEEDAKLGWFDDKKGKT